MSTPSNALNFLFQGQPPVSTTNYGQASTSIPGWLQQYTQGLLAQSFSLASQPYQPYSGPQVAGFTPTQTQAQSQVQNLQGGYLPTLQAATNLATNAANPTQLQTAAGYLPTASNQIQSALTPGAAQINPYAQNVILPAEVRAQQFWQNQLQPSIQQQYAASGQAGSSADIRAESEQANQLAESLQAQDLAALAPAYTGAQQAGLSAAGLYGQLGQEAGGLGYESGVLGLQGASQLGYLGQLGQTLGLQGAGALDTIGQQQQQLEQSNLNTGYQNFLAQQQYPYQQAGWLSQMLSGTATPNTVPGTTNTAQTGYAPSYSASPLMQSLGLYGLLNQSGAPAARGGRMSRRRLGVPSQGFLPVRMAA